MTCNLTKEQLEVFKKGQPKSSNRKDYIYLRGSSAEDVRKEYYRAAGFTASQIILAEAAISESGFAGWRSYCLDTMCTNLLPEDKRAWYCNSIAEAKAMPAGSRAADASKEQKALHRKRQKALEQVRHTAQMIIEDWQHWAQLYDEIANAYIEEHRDSPQFKEFWAEQRDRRKEPFYTAKKADSGHSIS